jgi:hypothetical protein
MGAAGSAAAQQLPDLPEVALDLGAPNWGACAAAAADALDGVVKVQQALGEGKAAQAAAVSYVGGMVSRRSTNQVRRCGNRVWSVGPHVGGARI